MRKVFLTLFATLAAICGWCLLVLAAVNEGWFKSPLTTSRAPAAFVEAAQRSVFATLAGWFPEAPQVYDSLAYAHWRRGDVERARDIFRKALELQPGFSSDYSSADYGADDS